MRGRSNVNTAYSATVCHTKIYFYIHRLSDLLVLYPALIINAVGLVLSLIVFVIEIIIHKTSLRCAAGVTQDRLEVDHYYQSGDGEEPSLTVVKNVRDKSKKSDFMEEENMTRE